ncbi:MAG TPA: YaiO family outer membrane beta-barrel protein [Patescibacteria group bacterium]|nr:YaiO family outer membrane beta-barrel protein [Patescibacteria group bacterium]
MRINRLLALILSALLSGHVMAFAGQEKAEVGAKLREEPVRYIENNRLFFSSYYEYSAVKQDGRKGQWRLFTNTAGYSFANGFTPYFEADSWERFHNSDQLFNTGAYLTFKDSSYLHSEIGFGNDITYLPKFRFLQEYEHRLAGSVSWQAGFKYLHYPSNDVYTGYPGLIYYFGDNYLGAFYDASFTESRGAAHAALFKGNIALNKYMNLWFGGAAGERLYDIDLLKASRQYGYIVYSGADFKVYKELRLRLGFSYGTERPAFVSRSIDYGLSVKF